MNEKNNINNTKNLETEIIYYNKDLKINNLSVTIGAYDGIHNGHIQILKALKELNSPKAVITFMNHPDYVLNKRENYGDILTIEEKVKIFNRYDINYLIILPDDVFELTYLNFNNLLSNLGVKNIIVGEDFKYGKNALGNINTLTGFNVNAIKLVLESSDDKLASENKLSSQTIRKYLSDGMVDKLQNFGMPYFSVIGKVTQGAKLGRVFGFPTANIPLGNKYSNIRKGVYAVKVIIGSKEYIGVCNVGINPTVNTQNTPRLEVYIINEKLDLYECEIEVIFKKFIRPEIKFASIDDLSKQISNDVQNVKKYFNK